MLSQAARRCNNFFFGKSVGLSLYPSPPTLPLAARGVFFTKNDPLLQADGVAAATKELVPGRSPPRPVILVRLGLVRLDQGRAQFTGLLQMANVIAGVGDQQLPLPQVTAPDDHLVVRPERGPQQSAGV